MVNCARVEVFSTWRQLKAKFTFSGVFLPVLLMPHGANIHHFLYLHLRDLIVRKVYFPESLVSSSSAYAPIAAHDIGSRCGMWEVVLIFVLFLTFLKLLRDYRQYPRFTDEERAEGLATLRRSLLTIEYSDSQPKSACRHVLLHAAQGWRTPTQGFQGRLLRVMHNSWPLWTFQLRSFSIMGNPNGDLFIKTISLLFVISANHKGATGRPGVTSSSTYSSSFWGSSRLHVDLIAACHVIQHSCRLPLITALMMHCVWAVLHQPKLSVQLSLIFFIISAPIPLSSPPCPSLHLQFIHTQ